MFRIVVLLAALCGRLIACARSELDPNWIFNGAEVFQNIARSFVPVTEKVNRHAYDIMYGRFLVPMVENFRFLHKPMKFLEIGFGCDTEKRKRLGYGFGASVPVWQKLFSRINSSIWEAESDKVCIQNARNGGQLRDVSVLIGDQSNETTLARWIYRSGGDFDVIIDDGGHKSEQVLKSFAALWPELNPGGYYFIEALEVGFVDKYASEGYPAVPVVIQAWIEHLITTDLKYAPRYQRKAMAQREKRPNQAGVLSKFPFPEGLDYIFCQSSGCVFHKEVVRTERKLRSCFFDDCRTQSHF